MTVLSDGISALQQYKSPSFVSLVWSFFIPCSMHDCIYFAWSVSFSCAVNTHSDTHSPFIPPSQPLDPTAPCRCHHFAVRPHSWPADPLLGVWLCQGLRPVTSSVTMSPLPPPALLSIVRLTVSGLVLAEDSAGAARSLCKWWKRARELCWKRGPCLAELAAELIGRRLSPLTVTSVICGDKKEERMCLMSRFE